MSKYISYDPKTESLELSLPEEFKDRSESILQQLMEEFGFEPVTPELVLKMEKFILEKLEENKPGSTI